MSAEMVQTRECKDGDHELCEGIILRNQQECTCPCHESDDAVFGIGNDDE